MAACADNLTVNYGVRYEYFTPMFDRNNLLTNIDPATGAIVTARDSGSVRDRTLIEPDRNDFAPRVGVAWSVTPPSCCAAVTGVLSADRIATAAKASSDSIFRSSSTRTSTRTGGR